MRALRLIFRYEGNQITLIRQQEFDSPLPIRSSLSDAPGYHVVSRAADGRELHRVATIDAFQTMWEVRRNGVHSWVPNPNASGSFTVIVPQNDELDHFTIDHHEFIGPVVEELEAGLFERPMQISTVGKLAAFTTPDVSVQPLTTLPPGGSNPNDVVPDITYEVQRHGLSSSPHPFDTTKVLVTVPNLTANTAYLVQVAAVNTSTGQVGPEVAGGAFSTAAPQVSVAAISAVDGSTFTVSGTYS